MQHNCRGGSAPPNPPFPVGLRPPGIHHRNMGVASLIFLLTLVIRYVDISHIPIDISIGYVDISHIPIDISIGYVLYYIIL